MSGFSDDGQWWWDGQQWIATSQVVIPELPIRNTEGRELGVDPHEALMTITRISAAAPNNGLMHYTIQPVPEQRQCRTALAPGAGRGPCRQSKL